MNTLERLQELMQELGPSVPMIDWLIQESERSWSIGMNDGTELGISFCASPDRLILSAVVGTPEAPDRQAAYAAMLCTNLLYAEEQALRIALTGPEGDLILLSEVMPPEWTLSEVSDALCRFSETAQHFIEGLGLSIEDITESTSHFSASVRA